MRSLPQLFLILPCVRVCVCGWVCGSNPRGFRNSHFSPKANILAISERFLFPAAPKWFIVLVPGHGGGTVGASHPSQLRQGSGRRAASQPMVRAIVTEAVGGPSLSRTIRASRKTFFSLGGFGGKPRPRTLSMAPATSPTDFLHSAKHAPPYVTEGR